MDPTFENTVLTLDQQAFYSEIPKLQHILVVYQLQGKVYRRSHNNRRPRGVAQDVVPICASTPGVRIHKGKGDQSA